MHAALTDEFESANAGSGNVERVNGLIYAVEAWSRAAIYMSPDMPSRQGLCGRGLATPPMRSPRRCREWHGSVGRN